MMFPVLYHSAMVPLDSLHFVRFDLDPSQKIQWYTVLDFAKLRKDHVKKVCPMR